MSGRSRFRVPSYRLHKQSGQAIVTLPDGMGGRRDVLLGKYDSRESKAEYARVVAEWTVGGMRLPANPATADLPVNELLVAYWKHAEVYYGYDKGRRGDSYSLQDALRIVKQLYGTTAAADFGPKKLKACRQKMIKAGWSRTYINHQIGRLRRMFRWAACATRARQGPSIGGVLGGGGVRRTAPLGAAWARLLLVVWMDASRVVSQSDQRGFALKPFIPRTSRSHRWPSRHGPASRCATRSGQVAGRS